MTRRRRTRLVTLGLVLRYTVAAERPRRISLPGLAACVVLFLAVVARYNPGGDQPRHQVEFFLVTALLYLLAPMSAWVLGDSMGYRRAYSRIQAVVCAYETGLIAPRDAG